MEFGFLLQLLTAAGLGGVVSGVITQWFSRSGERRQARAAVRAALSELEDRRWTRDVGEETDDQFVAAKRAFTTAAMIAGLPRDLAEQYVAAASASAALTKDKAKHNEHLSIDSKVNRHIQGYADLVAQHLWHPVLGRARYKHRLRRLKEQKRALVQEEREDAVWLKRVYNKY